jgi:hypothetical protein
LLNIVNSLEHSNNKVVLLVRKEGLALDDEGDEFCNGSSSVNVGEDRVNVRSNKANISSDRFNVDTSGVNEEVANEYKKGDKDDEEEEDYY